MREFVSTYSMNCFERIIALGEHLCMHLTDARWGLRSVRCRIGEKLMVHVHFALHLYACAISSQSYICLHLRYHRNPSKRCDYIAPYICLHLRSHRKHNSARACNIAIISQPLFTHDRIAIVKGAITSHPTCVCICDIIANLRLLVPAILRLYRNNCSYMIISQ